MLFSYTKLMYMKFFFKVLLTILLFIFSFIYLKKAVYFIKMHDNLMQEIISKEKDYNKEPINAIITNNTIIPGLSGRKVNLDKSYNKMKKLNIFNESLLVFDDIKPNISFERNYDKIILRGNEKKKRISIVLNINNDNLFNNLNDILKNNNLYADILTNNQYYLENSYFKNIITTNYNKKTNYCLTYDLSINSDCINNHKYTILGNNINNYYLTESKNILRNGIIIIYTFNESNYYNLNTLIKYFKNNNYDIVTIDKLIKE